MTSMESIVGQAGRAYDEWVSTTLNPLDPKAPFRSTFQAGYVAARLLDIEPEEEGAVVRFEKASWPGSVMVAVRHAGSSQPWAVSGTAGHRSWGELRAMMKDGLWERCFPGSATQVEVLET